MRQRKKEDSIQYYKDIKYVENYSNFKEYWYNTTGAFSRLSKHKLIQVYVFG